jgi:hypothetical protein
MKPGKEEILRKTHYGLTIYAHILHYYYPGEIVLYLSGKDCHPAKNPFNANKFTLQIKITNGCAVHTDTENAIAPGDVFDFAKLHFGLEGEELLSKLNDDLYLRLGDGNSPYPAGPIDQNPYKQISSVIKSPAFSYFIKPVSNTIPARQTSLLEVYNLIKGTEFNSSTNTLRAIQDSKEARRFKAQHFDYVTFSGTFSQRNDANLIRHSGLLTIDFDHIADITGLRNALLVDPYFDTELLFISPSGDGLKWIIPIDLNQVKHKDYFKAVANYVKQSYKLEVDQSGKDLSRACFLPHDPEIFIHSKYW